MTIKTTTIMMTMTIMMNTTTCNYDHNVDDDYDNCDD